MAAAWDVRIADRQQDHVLARRAPPDRLAMDVPGGSLRPAKSIDTAGETVAGRCRSSCQVSHKAGPCHGSGRRGVSSQHSNARLEASSSTVEIRSALAV